jgi:hypothetical protein
MVDPGTLSKIFVSFLAPVTPYLLKGGEQAWSEASKKIGPDLWEWVKKSWMKLISRAQSKLSGGESSTADILKAAQEVAEHPADEDAKAALRFQVKKLLAEDPELSLEMEKTLETAQKSAAEQGIRIGGVDISGGSTVTNSGSIVGGNQIISGQ